MTHSDEFLPATTCSYLLYVNIWSMVLYDWLARVLKMVIFADCWEIHLWTRRKCIATKMDQSQLLPLGSWQVVTVLCHVFNAAFRRLIFQIKHHSQSNKLNQFWGSHLNSSYFIPLHWNHGVYCPSNFRKFFLQFSSAHKHTTLTVSSVCEWCFPD